MSCTITAIINGNIVNIPIIEGSTEDLISISSIQKIYDQLKYIKSNEEIISGLYLSKDDLDIREADDDFKQNITKRKFFAGVKTSAKNSLESLFKDVIIYKSNVDNDIKSIKIYNQRILVIGDNILDQSEFKLFDALINLNVDNETAQNKIQKAKEFVNDNIVEKYTNYLFEQESAQNIYLQNFAQSNIIKYNQSIKNRNIFYYPELSDSYPLVGDIINKDGNDYIYLGLSGESDNYLVLLKIIGSEFDPNQIYVEKNISNLKSYKQKLPYNYSIPSEHDIHNLMLNQRLLEKGEKHSLNQGDIIKISSKKSSSNSVIVDVILNEGGVEYLIYNSDSFQYISESDVKEIVSVNSKLNITSSKFELSEYSTVINLVNNEKALNYFNQLKIGDVIDTKDLSELNDQEVPQYVLDLFQESGKNQSDSKYRILSISPNNTLIVSKFGSNVREKLSFEDVKTIYLKNRTLVDNDLSILQYPLSFYNKTEHINDAAVKYAALNGYGTNLSKNKKNIYFYDSNQNYIYDLGSYRKLNIRTELIKNNLIPGDIISKSNKNFKEFYKVVSVINDGKESHINVSFLKDDKYVIFKLDDNFFNGDNVQVYSKNPERLKQFSKVNDFPQLSDSELDIKVISMLEDNFNIPVKIIDDPSQKFAYTDGEKIFINISHRENDNTYVIKHAVHEFIHLMLGNMRLKNPEDYRILIESYREFSQNKELLIDKNIMEIEESMVTELSNKLNFDDITKDSIDLDEEILKKINSEFAKLFGITPPVGNGWLAESVQSIINKYKKDFTFETTKNFQLSAIKQHNQFLKEIDKIKKECE